MLKKVSKIFCCFLCTSPLEERTEILFLDFSGELFEALMLDLESDMDVEESKNLSCYSLF